MTVLKCKMCGGALELTPGETVAECPYCGTKQTVPLVDDDKKTVLYERANRLRASADFDRAFSVYEGITQSYPRDAEAFWGELLCKYGIEYVDDPATGKKIPTCHRSSFTSILEDEAFEMVMENCDPASMQVYRQEAKQIDAIRKGIIEISSKEPPSDVFICYKETDENGNRTIDSVIAQDVYNALVKEGYRVFFSRISLEDKLGKEYEPYIFSALNSAKVMLVFGTKYEYFNAVWVKNEWNRYLHLISKGENKTLIPCYRDVDVYDMPKEFRKLQSQDMSKIGAIQDLVRGVGKLIRPGQVMSYSPSPLPTAKADVNPLLKRAFIFLEDGNFKEADEYCEKVLDMDPENARAYLGKLLAEKQLRKPDELKNLPQPFDNNNNYQKILRYGNSELVASVKGFVDFINQRNETERLTGRYQDALNKMNSANSEEDYRKAAKIFDTISGFKDSDGMAQECLNRAEAAKKDNIYSSALSHMKTNTVDGYKKAISIFRSIPEWKDSESKVNECQIKIEEIHAKQEADRVRREHRKAVAKQNAKRTVSFVTPLIAVGIILAIIVVTVIRPKQRVDEAMRMINAGNVEEGYAVLEEMGKTDLIIQNKYDRAIALIENGDYTTGSELLAEVSGDEKIASARYNKAMEYINSENLVGAYYLLDGLDYKDSKEQLESIGDESKAIQTIISLSAADIGSVIQYGSYEQDGNTENGKEPIEWTVLAKEDDKVLLMAKNGLSHQPYNASQKQIMSWKDCSLRTWLNETFITEAFSPSEQLMLLGTHVITEDNPVYGTSAGEDTIDKVFLLSIEEAQSYFSSDSERKLESGSSDWWLRSAGSDRSLVAHVNANGEIVTDGTPADNGEIAVCPALWVSNDANILNSIELTMDNFSQYLDISVNTTGNDARAGNDGVKVYQSVDIEAACKGREPVDMMFYGVVVNYNLMVRGDIWALNDSGNYKPKRTGTFGYFTNKSYYLECDSKGNGNVNEHVVLDCSINEFKVANPNVSDICGRVVLKEAQKNEAAQAQREVVEAEDPIAALFDKCGEEISSGNYKEANSTLSQLEEMRLGTKYNDTFIRLAETAAEADNSSMVRRIMEITGESEATVNLNHYLALDEVGKMFIIDNESLSRAKELLDSLPDDYPGVREYKDLIDLYGDYIGIYHGNMGDDLQVFITEGRPGVEKIWSKEHGYFTYPNMFTDENVNGNIWTLISTTHVQRTDNQNRAADYADYRR